MSVFSNPIFSEIDVEYFPFDYQECKMKFGSWTYDGYTVKKTLIQSMPLQNFSLTYSRTTESVYDIAHLSPTQILCRMLSNWHVIFSLSEFLYILYLHAKILSYFMSLSNLIVMERAWIKIDAQEWYYSISFKWIALL